MSLRTFFSRVVSWFESVSSFLQPAAAALAAGGGLVLIAAAKRAVAAVEADPSLLTAAGSEKRGVALRMIAADLYAAGVPVVMNAVNIAIEAAVAGLAKNAARQ
jgi:predicted RNA methylase